MIEIIYLLVTTHITIICVTLFLHRGLAHRGIVFHPYLSHFMRFWLWLTTSMNTKEWVAVHRRHHRYVDESLDPHSPRIYGLWRVVFAGAFLYDAATLDRKSIVQYGSGTPDDWIEHNLYNRYSIHGILLLLVFNVLLFHGWGIVIWLAQMVWIPFWAAGIINGVGHYYGYRNYKTSDTSKNIVPWGILIGGEELHNNHHNQPASPKLSNKWWEFDLGWIWLKLLISCKLASVSFKG